jgi:HSP20 family molecular chaperone IbpA
MQNNKNGTQFNPLLTLVNDLIKNTTSKLEKDFLHNVCSNPLLEQHKFPVSDTYVSYIKNDEGLVTDEVDNISLKIYLAGYTKENIDLMEDPTNNSFIISGSISDNEHFPTGDHVKRYTNGASSRKFKIRYSMIPKFKLNNVTMKDGVLSINFIPNKELQVKKINIE